MFSWANRLRQHTARLVVHTGDLLFPPHCLCCDTELHDTLNRRLCGACSERVAPIVWNGCRRCGTRMPELVAPTCRCLACRRLSLHFDAAVPLGAYHEGLDELILRMKKPSQQAVSIALAQLLAQRRHDRLRECRADLIVPIPMFWTRRLRRGVNNPDVLADVLGRSLKVPSRTNVLVQRRRTRPQHHLPRSYRFENMRDAFKVQQPEAVRNRRVLLVDDVLTTGATCSEAAKVLKRAGATAVWVAVIARTQDD